MPRTLEERYQRVAQLAEIFKTNIPDDWERDSPHLATLEEALEQRRQEAMAHAWPYHPDRLSA